MTIYIKIYKLIKHRGITKKMGTAKHGGYEHSLMDLVLKRLFCKNLLQLC